MKMIFEYGDDAPDFCLPDANGNMISLSGLRGRNVVLFFYPSENARRCTIQAVDFTNLKKHFDVQNAVILGINSYSRESHLQFIRDNNLKVLLLTDADSEVQKKYGVWKPDKESGEDPLPTVRSTFLINSRGEIVKEWRGIENVSGHAEEVLSEVKLINSR